MFGAAQMADGRGIQCPGCQARRNSPRSEGVLGNAAAALEDTSEALMGWGWLRGEQPKAETASVPLNP